MIAPKQFLLLLFLFPSLSIPAQSSNGTWQGKTQIDDQEYIITVIIQTIDSTANTSSWYHEKVTGTLILERSEKREFFPLKGIIYDDQSVHLFQKQAENNSNCRWALTMGHLKPGVLSGAIQQSRKDDVCLPGSYLKLKKVKPKA